MHGGGQLMEPSHLEPREGVADKVVSAQNMGGFNQNILLKTGEHKEA